MRYHSAASLNPAAALWRAFAWPALACTFALAPAAYAQLSLPTAVDLALSNNPRVKMAQADAAKARAAFNETKDAYVPSLTAGAGLGEAYGYSPNPPTLFTFNAGSLVYSSSQFAFIRSARASLSAAQLALIDAREAVAEDAATTFAALDKDQKRESALRQESDYANHLVAIVSERFDAGLENRIDLTSARLTAAQIRLNALRAQDDTINDSAHLQRIMGVPVGPLQIEGGFPSTPLPPDLASRESGDYASASVASAFAVAAAKLQQAVGDARFLYRPQINLFVQYNRYATFTNSFSELESIDNAKIGTNEYAVGVQIALPLFDKSRKAKARESAADAVHSLNEARNAQINVLDAQTKLSRSVLELQARADVAVLEQQLAQQQLDVLQVQLNTVNPNGGPQTTPKDEQNQRIAERDKYLGVVDAAYQLEQAEISLLRQTGRLEEWLHQAALTPTPTVASPIKPKP